jgi:hypothetical protein
MHGMEPHDEIEYWRERAKRAESNMRECSSCTDRARVLAEIVADSNITLEQRRKAEQDAKLAQYACLELAKELERTKAERDEVTRILDQMERP